MGIIEFSVKRPVSVAMIMLAFAGLGIFCYFQLPVELFPKIEFPMVTVMTTYQGAGPEEVEQLITKEIEDEVSTVEGVKHLRSISQQGISIVMIEFYLETDVDVAAADVRDKVNIVRDTLPKEADDPVVQKLDFNAEPVMQLAVAAPRPLTEIFQMADRRIKDRVSTVPGVASVTIIGGEEREIHVLTDQQRLRANGLNITDVIATINAVNLESPGGQIQQNSREFTIQFKGKFYSLDEIRNAKIITAPEKNLYIRDIAEVKDAYKDIRDKVRASGNACVGMSIQKRSDGNTVKVVRHVKKEIEKLRSVLPADYKITIEDESATWIEGAISNVFETMQIGILLTAVVLFLFLHNFRSMFIVALSMPISVATVFVIMYVSGFTVNMMSMMGLAMTIGVLVDNSILVLENVTRRIDLGEKPADAAIVGTKEISIAVAATTLTNIVVFVPIAFMGGIVGRFFRDMGLTACISTVVSLIVSFMLTPTMAAHFLGSKKSRSRFITVENILEKIIAFVDLRLEKFKNMYANVLAKCLRHRWRTVITAVMALILCFIGVGRFIGFEFITSMDEGKFSIIMEMPTGTRLEETDAAVAQVEQVLEDPNILPELTGIYSSIGRTLGGRTTASSQSVNQAQLIVHVVDKNQRRQSTREIMDRLRPVIAAKQIPGAKIKILEEAEGPGGAPIQMEITADDVQDVKAFVAEGLTIIQQIPGVIDLDTDYRPGQPEVKIIPDRIKCEDAAVDSQYLARTVAAAFDGLLAGEYREGGFSYDIRIRNSKQSRKTIDDIDKLTVINNRGQLIPLPQIAAISYATGPSQLFRKNRQSLTTISCDATGISTGELAAEIVNQLKPLLEKYPGVSISFAGQIERMQESFVRLGIALIMAVCLTYMVIASLLESYVQPLIVMITVPLSLIGVLLALFLMGGTFSIFSIMAIVILVGLVVNNAIIVIDYIKTLRAEGAERTEAIIQAVKRRMRPLLMTNLTTIIALVPLALGRGWGGEMMSPMAMVQIGGLIVGGWLGLLVVPVLYTIFDDLTVYVQKITNKIFISQ